MKKADIIVIAAVLAVAGILCLLLYGGNHGGQQVQIEIDGTVSEVLPLSEDCEKEIITPDGGSNTLVIADGAVWMKTANCPDKICVHHPKISRSGESIICLPHRLVITVTDSRQADEVDLAG